MLEEKRISYQILYVTTIYKYDNDLYVAIVNKLFIEDKGKKKFHIKLHITLYIKSADTLSISRKS